MTSCGPTFTTIECLRNYEACAYLVDVVHEAVDDFSLARFKDNRLKLHVEKHVARCVHDDAVTDRLEAAHKQIEEEL